MPEYQVPVRDMQFVLFEVLQSEAFWEPLNLPGEVDREMAEAIIGEAAKIAEEQIAPHNREADEQGCEWQDGEVKTPAGFKEAYQVFSEGGWGALGGNMEYGGMGLPKSLVSTVEEMVQGACMSFGLAPMLTAGACLTLDAHASGELKDLYLPKMYSGEWSGSMDLTEPHAGTDLGLIRSRAEPLDDGSYRISGTKIFITWGEHDMAANIIHLVLAKLPDAPDGSKGISLFLVPKFIPDADGNLGERNAFSCGSLEKKMGIKASATCVMNFDGAKGWLVGEPHKGLACMFTMMNYERLVVGIQAVGAAEQSYQNALSYARERLQSRSLKGVQHPEQSADPILVHPDVRRMLLTMKACNEASRAFYVYVAQWLDRAKFSAEPEIKSLAQNRVALLTPVAKAFLTDIAFETSVLGQQVFGGHGYVREWGQEQLVRDIRITQIYEGTNGVQAMDLIGRKTVACNGAFLEEYLAEISEFLENDLSNLPDWEATFLQPLQQAVDCMRSITQWLVPAAQEDANVMGAVANDYLHMLGYLSFAYVWAKMALAAKPQQAQDEFYRSKIKTAEFYFRLLLPKMNYLAERIQCGAEPLMAFEDEEF